MNIFRNKSSRAVILVMTALSFIFLIISYFYFGNQYEKIDPRITGARELYGNYDEITGQNNFIRAFNIIDSIDNIYSSIDHYKNSFERGVLFNNKCAAIITIAMIKDSTDENIFPKKYRDLSKDSLIMLAEESVLKSLKIYDNWYNKYKNKSESELKQTVSEDFFNEGLDTINDELKQDYLNNRLEEINTALLEFDRRKSVSLTNLGMVYRHQENYEKALVTYKKAVDLWEDNLTAANNINVLLGKPKIKKSLIRKIFPKDRDKGLNNKSNNK